MQNVPISHSCRIARGFRAGLRAALAAGFAVVVHAAEPFVRVALASPQHRPLPVAHVDLQRYSGTWHEIALIPNRFQRGCVRGTTATYMVRPDGMVEVVNRCIRDDGSVNEARGVARIVDLQGNARLKVSFVKVLGRWLFWGDYWVLGLGPDYEYAVVGTPDRKYGWILARAPVLSPQQRAEVDAILREQGYDPARFRESNP